MDKNSTSDMSRKEAAEESQYRQELAALSEWKFTNQVKSLVPLRSKVTSNVRYEFSHQVGDTMYYDKYRRGGEQYYGGEDE